MCGATSSRASGAALAQEEAFVGRCGQVDDELGSAVVAARLVRELMRLCFLIEREYAPYSKWLGTAFARLSCAPALLPPLQARARRDGLARTRSVTSRMPSRRWPPASTRCDWSIRSIPRCDRSSSRPFRVLDSNRFAAACLAATPLRELGWVGAIDQFVDSTDVLSDASRVGTIAASEIWPTTPD